MEANVGDEDADIAAEVLQNAPAKHLFGPHFESNKKTRDNSGADELRDYCQQTPHIPTMDNPLKWWAQNANRFPRLAKLSRSYVATPAPQVNGYFPWQAPLSPDSGQASFPHMLMLWSSLTQTKKPGSYRGGQ
ncbi:hypothetical protein KUCAC02_005891 [Chaenocephalus aceratus]|uniref:Uncharacterized protein n=1 Tax=Chaenocephalus aceratus TaxID=36190 RepID=A0ACB9WQP1_CHAAC|nr:hypothetical protein KUCAC02_005891 [Chaenocephalus aceratus]